MDSIDSPTFISHTANQVVNELLLTKNSFNNDNHETPTSFTTTADKSNSKNTDENEIEFEFPIDEHISPQFPLFDRTLLLDLNHNSKSDTDSKPAPALAPEPLLSLRKLLIKARDSGSCSSSEADELDGITPETYCVWNQKESRGKYKKSNSVSIGNSSKRWNVRHLLKRSYSEDRYSTGNVSPALLFSPPISPKLKLKDDSGAGAGVESAKTVNKIPAYNGKIGNIRLPAYYPYRQDQIGAFGNVNG